jgi:hypothetical protein
MEALPRRRPGQTETGLARFGLIDRRIDRHAVESSATWYHASHGDSRLVVSMCLEGFAPMSCAGRVPRASLPFIAQATATISDVGLDWLGGFDADTVQRPDLTVPEVIILSSLLVSISRVWHPGIVG